jgi:hypothetical protein
MHGVICTPFSISFHHGIDLGFQENKIAAEREGQA